MGKLILCTSICAIVVPAYRYQVWPMVSKLQAMSARRLEDESSSDEDFAHEQHSLHAHEGETVCDPNYEQNPSRHRVSMPRVSVRSLGSKKTSISIPRRSTIRKPH